MQQQQQHKNENDFFLAYFISARSLKLKKNMAPPLRQLNLVLPLHRF